jgi:hypothetical protein
VVDVVCADVHLAGEHVLDVEFALRESHFF